MQYAYTDVRLQGPRLPTWTSVPPPLRGCVGKGREHDHMDVGGTITGK
jgi:hypothetical protein